MPTTAIHTWSGQKLEPFLNPEDTQTIHVKFVASTGLLAKGTVLGRVTASGLYAAYNNANANGTETATGILIYDINVDANGNVTFTTTAGQVGDLNGHTSQSAPVYTAGTFRTTDLVGLDAPALDDLRARLVTGTLADGTVRIG